MSISLHGFFLLSSAPHKINPISPHLIPHSCRFPGAEFPKRHQPKTRARASASPVTGSDRPQHLESDSEETHYMNLLKESLIAENFGEFLRLLECIVGKGYKAHVFFCAEFILRLCGSKQFDKAVRVVHILEDHGEADCMVYTALITAFCKAGLIEPAFQVLGRMTSQGCPPNNVTHDVLVRGLRRRQMLDSALAWLWDDNRQPYALVSTVVVEAAALQGWIAVDKTARLLDEMVSRGLRPASYTLNILIQRMCKKGLVDAAHEFLNRMSSRGCDTDVVLYNNLLRGYYSCKRWNDLDKLIGEMLERGLEPDNDTYSTWLSCLCRMGKVDRAKQLVEDTIRSGLKLNSHSCNPLISAYCQNRKVDLAIELTNFMISNGCGANAVGYTNILSTLFKMGNAYRAMEVLDDFAKTGCSPNATLYNTVIVGLWNNGNQLMALQKVLEMMDEGIQPSGGTYNALISCLCRDGMINEAISLLRDKESCGFKTDVCIYNTILIASCKLHMIDTAIDVLAEMVGKGCHAIETTYVTLLKGIANAGHKAEAIELAEDLAIRGVLSKHYLERLNQTFYHLFKEMPLSVD